VCGELGWTIDSARQEAMKAANEKEAARLEAAVKDAEENLGDIEVRDAHLAKAEFLYRIGAQPFLSGAVRAWGPEQSMLPAFKRCLLTHLGSKPLHAWCCACRNIRGS
jgi:hypothetical protein